MPEQQEARAGKVKEVRGVVCAQKHEADELTRRLSLTIPECRHRTIVSPLTAEACVGVIVVWECVPIVFRNATETPRHRDTL